MDQTTGASNGAQDRDEPRRCEAELHVRLCARRLTTGHLQFRWRVEHVDVVDQEASSLEGTFGPFELPHECGQEVAAVVRQWIKDTHSRIRRREECPDLADESLQLTLSDALLDSGGGS
jgi:hypothetical protein